MVKELVVRGVPASIAMDGWWLSATPEAATGDGGGGGLAAPAVSSHPLPRTPVGVLTLVVLGDVLFWRHAPGVSIAIFALAVFGVASLYGPRGRDRRRPFVLLVLSLLPVVEMVQALSIAIAFGGLVVALALLGLPRGARAGAISQRTARILRALPLSGARALLAAAHELHARSTETARATLAARLMRNWAFPVGGALVLGTLLVGANPLFERAITDLLDIDIDFARVIGRVLFWLGLGLLTWPLVTAPVHPDADGPSVRERASGTRSFGLNRGSVLRALVLFNLVLAVQTLTDASVFLGGAELPKGMSYASYAHRGAYPLLLATLLGGGFALAARRYLGELAALKPLLLLWLGQNILMGVAAAYRLDLYIDAYGLTYLRLRALIWIGLVIAGLALTGWQILRARSNRWLVLRSATLVLATFYVAGFVNFAGVIARWNLEHQAETGRPADVSYICGLGPMASAAVVRYGLDHPDTVARPFLAFFLLNSPEIDGWRDWGFRSWRVSRYLSAQKDGNEPVENPGCR